jgi:hypothetical protein
VKREEAEGGESPPDRKSRKMSEYSREFLERTVEVWQRYSSSKLTLEDAREIAENMVELFSLLMELDRKYGKGEEEGEREPCEAVALGGR